MFVMHSTKSHIPALFFVLAAVMVAGAWVSFHFAGFPALYGPLDVTYFVVPHMQVFFILSLFFCACGVVYLVYPRATQKSLSLRLGHVHFWLSLGSVAILFYTFHRLQLMNPTDAASFNSAMRSTTELAVAGFLGFMAAQIVFAVNVFWTFFRGAIGAQKPRQTRD